MSTDNLPPQVRESRWWYWIAAIPVLYVLVLAVLVVFVLPLILGESSRVFGFGEFVIARLAVGVALLAFLFTLMLPYALYRDIGLLNEYDIATAWNPDQTEYTILGAAGIFMSAVGFGVSIYYLYQRHVHVGIP
jgi:hypothetical protein